MPKNTHSRNKRDGKHILRRSLNQRRRGSGTSDCRANGCGRGSWRGKRRGNRRLRIRYPNSRLNFLRLRLRTENAKLTAARPQRQETNGQHESENKKETHNLSKKFIERANANETRGKDRRPCRSDREQSDALQLTRSDPRTPIRGIPHSGIEK